MQEVMSDKQEAILRSFLLPDPKSVGAFNAIMSVYPAMAKKIFDNTPFMQKVVMTNLNNMPLLDYPICGRCERLAVWNQFRIVDGRVEPKCTCFTEGCNATTVNPVLLRNWLADELKKRAPEGYLDIIDQAIDGIADMMMRKAMADLAPNPHPGRLVDANGNYLGENHVEHAPNDSGITEDEMIEQIKKEYEPNV